MTTIKSTTKALTITLLLLSQAPCLAQAQSDGVVCPIAIPPEEVIGETILCGAIDLPENWSESDGRSIGISYIVLKSTSLAPFKDPVIYLQGGPGGSGLNSMGLISSATEGLRANRDVILVDMRGTAHSNELFCPMDLQVTNPDSHDEDIAEADARIDALGVNAFSDPHEVYAAIDSYWTSIDRGRCVPYLEGKGIDLRQYNTANTVLDMVRLMQALDYPAYNLFGGSYGTTVALGIMDHYENTPDVTLPALRSVVIDGVAPRNREHYESSLADPYVVLRVFSGCEADAACGAAFPNIRQRAVELLAALQNAPIPRGDGSEISATAVAELLRSAVTSHQKLLPYMPRLVAELERRETTTFDFMGKVTRFEFVLPDAQTEAPAPAQGTITAQIDSITQQFDAIKEQLGLSLISNGVIRDSILEATTRTDLFTAMFDNYLDLGGGTVGNLVVAKLEPFIIHRDRRTREALADLVRTAVGFPSLQSEMLALIDAFSDDEIAKVFNRLTSAEFDRGRAVYDKLTHRVVSCNDEADTIFNDVAFQAYRAFEAPQLIGVKAYMTANYEVSCKQLGLAADAYAPPPPGVTSDVPTLVINGALDTATPAEWGFRAAETLRNAKVVTIPMGGHTIGLLSKCGNALVQAYVLDPKAELDLSCAEAERPVFAGPEEALPE